MEFKFSLSLNADQMVRPICYQVTGFTMEEHYLFLFEDLFFLVMLYICAKSVYLTLQVPPTPTLVSGSVSICFVPP